jgi:tetratricopeptide (TPR) repeat protein
VAEALLPRDVLALVRLFPILRRVEVIANARQRAPEIPDSQELRRRAFAAFRELMARIAARHPLVLFIDDLQWGDADSAVLLTELMRSPDAPPLLLLAAYRTEEATSSAPLRTLLAASAQARPRDAVRELVVGELQRSEAQTLARALMDERDRTGWTADTLAREGGGSPYLIAELASYAKSREVAGGGFSDAVVATQSRPGEISLDEVIHRRVQELPDAARRLLEILAVSGRPLSLSIASRAGGISSLELDALAALRAARLSKTRVIEGREEIETYHDRIRETVVAHLEPVTLRAHHTALALTLENFSGADPEALAAHFQGAGDYENAARYAIAAGDRATDALAFDNAVRLYRLGLDLHQIDGGNRQLIHVKLGDALANAGRGRDAAHAYLAAVNGATAADRLELQRRAAEQLLRSGHIDEAIVTIRAVLATMGMHLAQSPQRALFSMLLRRLEIRLRGLTFDERDVSQIAPEALVRIDVCWSIAIGLGIVDNIRGGDFQARHLLLALRTGEPFRITRALSIEVAYSAIPGGARARHRAHAIGEMAQQLADRLGSPLALGLVAISRGTAAHLLGEWRSALEHCERAEPILRERCTGVGWELAIAHLYSLLSLQYLGELGELSRRLPVLIKEARERDDLHAVTNYQTRLSYIRCLAADDPDGARKEVREGIDVWYHKTYTSQHYFELLASVEIALYTGDGPTAWGHIERHWSALKRSLLLRVQRIRIESLFIRGRSGLAAGMMASDDHHRAAFLAVAKKAIRELRRQDAPHAAAIADLLATGLGTQTANVARHDVAMLLENTALVFAQEEMALHAAATRRRLGEISGGARGSALMSEADAWMNAHGIENPERMTQMLAPGQYRS